MDLLGQSALILAVTAFTLTVNVLSKNLRNKLSLAFAALCSVIWGWSFFFFLEKVFGNDFFYRVHSSFHLLLAPVGLVFLMIFTRIHTGYSKVVLRVSWLCALILVPFVWTDFFETVFFKTVVFLSPLFLAAECAHLMYRDRLIEKGEISLNSKLSTVGYQRRSWIFVGAFLVILTCTMDHIPVYGDVIPSVGNLALCFYLFLVSEAITQQRLFNVTGLINRLLVLAFLSLSLTVVYTVLVAWVQNSPGLFLLNTFLASFIILMLIDPIKKLISVGVTQLFYRQQLKLEQKAADYQLQLTGILEPVSLAGLTLEFLESTLKVESASIFVLRSDGTKFRRIRGIRDENLDMREILAVHPVIEYFLRMKRKGETPVLLDKYIENEIDRTVSQLQKQNYEMILLGLKGLNANIAIPFITEQAVLGFVAVKSFAPPEPWGTNWGLLTVVYPYFLQAARVMKNMDIYVRLREKDRLAALGVMAAGLAHEIRNPLGSIKGAAQLLSGSPEAAANPFTKVIVEEVNRLNKVVTQFLDYSRSAPVEMVPYDVSVIVERTIDLVHSSENASDVNFIVDIQHLKSLSKIKCNPEQIKQVLLNFIQNAIHSIHSRIEQEGIQGVASESGRIEIGARIEENLLGKKEYVLFIEDNGKGIPKENLEKVFIPFFTTSPSGTGLGLSICARILEVHGGRVEVISEEGLFARFVLHFPLEDR